MSLTSCLRKAGDALPMRDSAAIMASALKYRATGMDANAAAQQAVTDRLETVRTEIAQAATAAVNQGQDDDVRGTFSPSTNTITLLKKANLSTFAHETGHLYLEILSDLASQEGAPAEIVEDMGKVLKWFGIKGTETVGGPDVGGDAAPGPAPTLKRTPQETWAAMSLEQKRPFHEQFARGWEGYLFEGKSPSTGLSKVFRRFSQWMLQIYKSIKNLAAPLNADMRGVFDRLVASEEEIKAAELERQMAPLFADAKAAGMTEEEFAAYQALGQESQDDAIEQLGLRSVRDMKWLSNARDRLLREFQAAAAKERKAVREEVTAEVDAQPIEQARVELRKLAEADPETKKAIADWKARKKQQEVNDLAAVRAEYLDQQPDLVGLAKGQFLAKNKREIDLDAARRTLQWERENPAPDRPSNPISLDAVATQFGFEDGAALGRSLIESPRRGDLIDAMTDQRMMERHGDLINQSAVDAAVNEALHNEARARFVATELAALDKAVGKPRVLIDAARRFAAELIGRKLIKDVRPSVFQTAETRAAAEAAGTKDITVRVAAKRAQLFNHYAVKEATSALDEVDRGIKYLRRLETSESIDPEYKEQIDALLAGFDLRSSTSNKQIKRTQSLGAWVEAQREMGIEPDIPEALLLENERGSYKALTVDEFRGLVDTVRQIEHLGRLKHKLLLAKDAKEMAAIREEMAASIIANGGKPRPVKLEGQSGPAKLWDGFTAAHRKLSSLFRQMDGGKDDGPMWQFIGRSMNERGTWEDSRIERATVELRRLYDKVTALPGGVSGWRSKVHIKEIDASMTRGGRLAVALNWGNEDNRQRLLGNYEGGNHWSESQVRAIMKTLTPDELAFVNGVWAHLDSYWPEIAAKQKKLTGKEPERVVPAPFTVTAADGTEVMMSGGYYPLKYDQERSVRASNQDQQQLAKDMMRGAVTSSTTRRGHTKERVQEVKRPVRLDLNVITEHVSQVVHDLAWHEWLIDTNRLLKSDDVSGAISSHYGMEAYKTIQKGLEDIASGGLERSTAIDAVLLQIRSNITRATMGASLTTAFLQPFGLTQSMVRIGPKHVMRGAARWAGDAVQMENTLAWIQDKSEFMRLRSKTFNRELREIRGTVKGKTKTMQVIDAGLFALMQKMQLIADVPTWVGQYEKTKDIGAEYKAALARGLGEAEAAAEQESAAVTMADRAVAEAQGAGHIKDLSEVQRKHPMLTQFYSYFNVTLNLAAESTAATDFKNPRAVAGWLGDMALLMVIPSIMPALLMHLIKSGGAGDDEPEEWVKRVAKWQAGYLLGLTVGLREGSGLLEGFDYAGPPVGRLVGDIGKAGKQLAQGEMDEAAVLASINLMGSAFGIPVVQASRSYKGWKAWEEGKEGAGPQSVLFGPPPRN